ncbi:MAG: hypothetical protein ACRC2K_12635 [Clostridium sp.]
MDNTLEALEFKLYTKESRGTINGEISYTITLKNGLCRDIFDLIIPIQIPEFTRYKEDSLFINEIKYSLAESNSFRIPKFPQDSIFTLTYKVIIDEIPLSGVIENKGIVTYIDEITGEEINTSYSNKVVTMIKGVKLDISGSLDTEVSLIGDEVNYEVNIINTGNIRALDVEIQEFIPRSIKLKSMLINGNNILKNNYYDTLKLGNIDPGRGINLKWSGIVIDVTGGKEEIKSKINYSVYDNESNKILAGDSIYHIKYFEVMEGILSGRIKDKSLTLNKLSPLINEEISINFEIENRGNMDCEKGVFKLFSCEGILFSNCSINGEKIDTSKLSEGISIQKVSPNESVIFEGQMKVISFNPKFKHINAVIEYESYNPLKGEYIKKTFESNELKIEGYGGILSLENGEVKKECSKTTCSFGDEIDYRITLKNLGNMKFSKIAFKEEKLSNSEFIPGSFKINNTVLNLKEINNDIFLGELEPQNIIEITYKMKVINEEKCDWLISKSLITCEQIRKSGEVVSKSFESVYDQTRIVYGMLEETSKKEDVVKCNRVCENSYIAELENVGNVPLNDIRIDIIKSAPVSFTSINIIQNDKKIENIIENEVSIPSISPGEKLIVEADFKVNDDAGGELEISADVLYFYDGMNELGMESGNLKLKPKKYEITNGNLLVKLDIINNPIFKDEKLIGSIIIENIGNVNLYNIFIEGNMENTLRLQRLDGTMFGERIYLNSLGISEKKCISIILTPDKNNRDKYFSFKGRVIGSYNFNGSEEIIEKEIEPLERELLFENMICEINSDKESYFVDEISNFTLTINNKGNHTLENVFLKINIPDEIDILDDIIYINNIPYKYSNVCNGTALDPIANEGQAKIKYKGKINGRNSKSELNTNFVINGYYKNGDKKISKEYISEELKNKIDEISVKCFLNTNKTLLLTNETIRYNATLINDGTVPVSLKFNLDCGEELQELSNSVDEISVEEFIEIAPSDGITIEKEFVYKGFRKASSAITKGIIDVYYNEEEEPVQIHKQIETELIEIELTSTTFKEILIENVIDIININPKIFEICKVYARINILNQNVRCQKRNYEFKSVDVEGYRLDLVGKVSYIIEYLSKSSDEGVNLFSFEKIFTSNVVLPWYFIEGSDVEVTQKILDTNYKIVDNERLFINTSILVNTSI